MKKLLISTALFLSLLVTFTDLASAQFTNIYLQYSQTGTNDPTVVATQGNTGSLYFKSSAPIGIYRKTDNGTTINWQQVSSFPPLVSGVANQLANYNGSGAISSPTGVAPNILYWDTTNGRLGIRKSSPQGILHLFNNSTAGIVKNTSVILGSLNATDAEGDFSVQTGNNTSAAGDNSFSSGSGTKANGTQSVALGVNTAANGTGSVSEGNGTQANADFAHVEGDSTLAQGIGSHVEGLSSSTTGNYAHSEGNTTQANADYSHAEGSNTVTTGIASHAEGESTQAAGLNSHAEGVNTQANNTSSHAEGSGSIAQGLYAHAEGRTTQANSDASHAEGRDTVASNTYSHAEGRLTTASGDSSHAQGQQTTAAGAYSHAGGFLSTATGSYAFAHGRKAQTGAHPGAFLVTDSQDFITGNDFNDQFKARYTSGFSFVKGGLADNVDGPNFEIFQATTTTTNNTLTTIQTIATATDTVDLVEVRCNARRTGGTAGSAGDSSTYILNARVKNVAGTVSVNGSQMTYSSEDNAALNVSISASGTNYVVQVQGDTNNNYTWDVTTFVNRK